MVVLSLIVGHLILFVNHVLVPDKQEGVEIRSLCLDALLSLIDALFAVVVHAVAEEELEDDEKDVGLHEVFVAVRVDILCCGWRGAG